MSPKKRAAELNPAALETLFSPLKRFRHLALAVSGGADSMALMLLAAEWKGRTKFSVLTVDHGLRAQSAREAKQVVKWARELGFKAHLMAWKEKKPASGLQARAREARYRLMAKWCAQNDADGVVTGHTLDDQAETLLMRLARGSGIDGLSAMAEETTLYGVRVLRPLLPIPRRPLEEFLKERGQAFIDDPSNANPAFERIRIRQAREQLAELGLKPEALALAARRLGRARQALEKATDELESLVVDFQAQGHAIIELAPFQAAAEEIRLRLLARLLERIGGVSPPPQLKEVERLSEWLKESLGRARTLGGCRVLRRSVSLIIGRESGRMSGEPVRIEPGETLIWDDRFKIRLGRAGGKSLVILPLGKINDAAQVKRPKGVPNFVFKTLPALIREGQVALVPHIGYRGAGFSGLKAEVIPLSRHLIIH